MVPLSVGGSFKKKKWNNKSGCLQLWHKQQRLPCWYMYIPWYASRTIEVLRDILTPHQLNFLSSEPRDNIWNSTKLPNIYDFSRLVKLHFPNNFHLILFLRLKQSNSFPDPLVFWSTGIYKKSIKQRSTRTHLYTSWLVHSYPTIRSDKILISIIILMTYKYAHTN